MQNGNDSSYQKFERAVDSVWARAFARFIVPSLAAGIVTITSWYIKDVNDALKLINTTLANASATDGLIKQEIQLNKTARDAEIAIIKNQVVDHEQRIRVIERSPSNSGLTGPR